MKTMAIILACVALAVVANPADGRDDEPITSAVVMPSNGDWYIVFYPDGSGVAHFRPKPTVSASLAAESVDFDALVSALLRLKTDEKNESGTNAGIHRAGVENVNGFYLHDDTLMRYLVDSFEEKWAANDEFQRVLAENPMFPKDE